MAQPATRRAQFVNLATTWALAVGCFSADALGVVVPSIEVGYRACTCAYACDPRNRRLWIVAVVYLGGYVFLFIVLVAADTTTQAHAPVFLSGRSRAVDTRPVSAWSAATRPCQVAQGYQSIVGPAIHGLLALR